jgi:hypothetical protein
MKNIHKLSKINNNKTSFIFKFETKQNKWQRYFERNKLLISNFRICKLREKRETSSQVRKLTFTNWNKFQISLSMRKWVKIGVVWFFWLKSEGVDCWEVWQVLLSLFQFISIQFIHSVDDEKWNKKAPFRKSKQSQTCINKMFFENWFLSEVLKKVWFFEKEKAWRLWIPIPVRTSSNLSGISINLSWGFLY